VLTNSFDTMLVADYGGQLLAYAAMASPAQPPPLAPVRLGAVAQWSAEHPDRLALVLNRAHELLVLRHGALVFAHRAGRWFFLAPEAIVQQMGGPRNPELRRAVYASCLDASFAGTGACLGILNAENVRKPAENQILRRHRAGRSNGISILDVKNLGRSRYELGNPLDGGVLTGQIGAQPFNQFFPGQRSSVNV
jgi:hypothetical protein